MYLFPPETPNRRLTPWEEQEEREVAKIFGRPMRTFIKDKPFYPQFPPTPLIPKLNFDLNFKQ